MLNKLLFSLYLAVGVMLLVTMLLYSLESGLEIMEGQDRDYQEYIQRESRWKKQYNFMRNADNVSTMKF